MKDQSHFFADLAAGLILFGGSLILAQTAVTTKRAPAATSTASGKQAVAAAATGAASTPTVSPNATTSKEHGISNKQAVKPQLQPAGKAELGEGR